jgi:hypothetical protein
LYTNAVGKTVAVPNPFGFITPLSEVLSVICERPSSFSLGAGEFFAGQVSFWKSKITDVKNCFFRCFAALEAVVPFWKALRSLTFFAALEYPVKK